MEKMMNKNQSTDAANMGRSGGVNNQNGNPGAMEHKPASIGPASNIPAKGTSNGGK
jgi:hypothetical protein